MRSDVKNREDVRMIQRRRGARFLLKAAKTIGIGRQRGRQDLDRDVATQPRVARPIDLAHSPSADGIEDFVGTEVTAWAQSHRDSGEWARRPTFSNTCGASPPRRLRRSSPKRLWREGGPPPRARPARSETRAPAWPQALIPPAPMGLRIS